MLELYEKLDILKNNLDDMSLFEELSNCFEKIKNNQELVQKIKQYNISKNEDLRLDIYKYKEIKEYKRIENEINLLICSINKKLKELKEEGDCSNACY